MTDKPGREITRAERHEKQNRGFTPAYQTKMYKEGSVINRIRYEKNMSRLHGLCKKCIDFVKKNAKTTDGSHCQANGFCRG